MTPEPDDRAPNRQDSPEDARTQTGDLRSPSIAEWTTFAIGLAIILGMVGLVASLYVFGGDEPPIIEAAPLMTEIRRVNKAYYLPIAITNRGDRSAEDVLVLVELTVGKESGESAELFIEFLAGGETAEGTAVFSADPASGQLTIDVASFR